MIIFNAVCHLGYHSFLRNFNCVCRLGYGTKNEVFAVWGTSPKRGVCRLGCDTKNGVFAVWGAASLGTLKKVFAVWGMRGPQKRAMSIRGIYQRELVGPPVAGIPGLAKISSAPLFGPGKTPLWPGGVCRLGYGFCTHFGAFTVWGMGPKTKCLPFGVRD